MEEPQRFEDVIKLPSLPLTFEGRRGLPEISAVYFAYSFTRKILYIGASQCVRKRWNTHHHNSLLNVPRIRIAWLPVPVSELKVVERRLISRFDPPMNTAVKSGKQRWVRLGHELERRSARRKRQREQSAA